MKRLLPFALSLDVYGITLRIDSDNAEICQALGRDFSFFKALHPISTPRIRIRVHVQSPPYDHLPHGQAIMIQPHFAAFTSGDQRWVDYGGKALSRWCFNTESGDLWSHDQTLLYEKCYLLVHSRIGELLDQHGYHRVHAAGLAIGDCGILLLLPSGGGKTTLAMEALKYPGVRLISDDTPLITRQGSILPFPLRIGLQAKPSFVPESSIRAFHRQEHGNKWLIDIEAFTDRIQSNRVQPGVILVGNRLLGGEPAILACSRWHALNELLRCAVVGLGLPQLVEYFLRLELSDIKNKSIIVASRLMASFNLARRSRTYRFDLVRDPGRNAQLLRLFLQNYETNRGER